MLQNTSGDLIKLVELAVASLVLLSLSLGLGLGGALAGFEFKFTLLKKAQDGLGLEVWEAFLLPVSDANGLVAT